MAKKQEAENPQQSQNVVVHKNGTVTDVDVVNRPSAVKAIMRDLGLEDDFVKQVIGTAIKEGAKQKVKELVRGHPDEKKGRSKGEKAAEVIKSLALFMFALLVMGILTAMALIWIWRHLLG